MLKWIHHVDECDGTEWRRHRSTPLHRQNEVQRSSLRTSTSLSARMTSSRMYAVLLRLDRRSPSWVQVVSSSFEVLDRLLPLWAQVVVLDRFMPSWAKVVSDFCFWMDVWPDRWTNGWARSQSMVTVAYAALGLRCMALSVPSYAYSSW